MIDKETQYPVQFFAETEMPACAVMEANGVTTQHGIICIKCRAYQAGPPPKVLLVNSPSTVSANTYGSASFGMLRHVRAAGSVNTGTICGPTNNSTSLSSGYPGFVAVGAGASNTTWVVRQPDNTDCKGLLTGALAANTSSISVDNVVALAGVTPVANSNSTLTVYNSIFEGDDNGDCWFKWNASTSHWEFYQVECPA